MNTQKKGSHTPQKTRTQAHARRKSKHSAAAHGGGHDTAPTPQQQARTVERLRKIADTALSSALRSTRYNGYDETAYRVAKAWRNILPLDVKQIAKSTGSTRAETVSMLAIMLANKSFAANLAANKLVREPENPPATNQHMQSGQPTEQSHMTITDQAVADEAEAQRQRDAHEHTDHELGGEGG